MDGEDTLIGTGLSPEFDDDFEQPWNPDLDPSLPADRYLDRDERYEIARLREAGNAIREIARMLGRSPATVSRELRRNVHESTGRYEPERADRLAWERQRRPRYQ